MPLTFFRLATDGTRTPVDLDGVFAGPLRSACWLIGGGPSLAMLPCEAIARSPVPKMCINLAGSRLLGPTFWTAYDPSERFGRSVYLDAGVMKFLPRRRAMDVVPGTSLKVCDCPAAFFFERDGRRGYADFLHSGHSGIVDWADSLAQAIEVLYRLGFRVIYLAGCEMRVRPSGEHIRRAEAAGVRYSPYELLEDFLRRCERAGLSADELDAAGPVRQYHFDQNKPLRAAADSDAHYFHVAQSLRLARRSMSLAGVQLISVTPHSRLNDDFPYVPARRVLKQIDRTLGRPQCKGAEGWSAPGAGDSVRRYGPLRDVRPPGWLPGEMKPLPSRPDDVVRGAADVEGEFLVEEEVCEPIDGRACCVASTKYRVLSTEY